MPESKKKCPRCGSTRTHSMGSVMLVSGLKKRRKCNNCGHTFYDVPKKKRTSRKA